MDDNCIITKYDLSEKEKELKSKFLSKKRTDEIHSNTIYKYSVVCNQNQQETINKINIPEDKLNKLIDTNFNSNQSTSINNQQSQFNSNPQQLNLLFSQNKILERNVDICQETQRILHDFLKYNIQNNENTNKKQTNQSELKQLMFYINEIKSAISDQNKHAVESLIKPLHNELEEIKNNLVKTTKNEEISNLQTTIKKATNSIDQLDKLNNYKENKRIIIEKDNKNPLNSELTELTKAIKLIETNIQSELKKMSNSQEQKNLFNLFSSNNTTASSRKTPSILSKIGEFDYSDLKNNLIDFQTLSDKLIDEFNYGKPKNIKLSNKNKEKVKFYYDLDEEEEENYKRLNKISTKNNKNKEKSLLIYPYKSEKNVFLDNLNTNANKIKAKKSQESNNSTKINLNTQNKVPLKNNKSLFISGNDNKQQNSQQTSKTNENVFTSTEKKLEEGKELNIFAKNQAQKELKEEKIEKPIEKKEDKEDYNKNIFNNLNKDIPSIENEKNGIVDTDYYKKSNKNNIIHDVVTKLLIDKLIDKNRKNQGNQSEQKEITIQHKLPIDNKQELKKAIQDILVEKIKNNNVSKNNQIESAKVKVEEKLELPIKDNTIDKLNELQKQIESRDKGLSDMMTIFIEKISNIKDNERHKETLIISKENTKEDHLSERYIERLTEKVTEKMTGKFNININIPKTDELERKVERDVPLTSDTQVQFEIKAEQKPIENLEDDQYNNPFDERREKNENIITQLPIPYFIDFNQYDVTSSYISVSRTPTKADISSIISKTNKRNYNFHQYTHNKQYDSYDESLSEGQIPNKFLKFI